MLRLTEIRLPIDHPEAALRAAILKRLGIPSEDLTAFSIFRRALDARKRTIVFTYTIDAELRNERAVLERTPEDGHVATAPDMGYRFVAHAAQPPSTRPVVIGIGPCGYLPG